MREFFQVVTREQASSHASSFQRVGTEKVPLGDALGRVLAADLVSDIDLPGFRRSTMDGFTIQAASSFGSSDSSPALVEVRGTIEMGAEARMSIERGQAARILTGGMLPPGADSVVMIEHAEALDDSTIEVTRSVFPGQNVIEADEDIARGETLIVGGSRLRPQDLGLLAALGCEQVEVFQKPVVAILSTGDEIVAVGCKPSCGQIRDVNSLTLSVMVTEAGGRTVMLGIVGDDLNKMTQVTTKALAESDVIMVSGGSSVGSRDLTLDLIEALPDSRLLFHGVAIRSGKPTILAAVGVSAFWGLPGHVASAMVVFRVLVRPFLEHIGGAHTPGGELRVPARLTRNIASAPGRQDYIRVKLEEGDTEMLAVPVPGKSGLIRTMVTADGVIEIDINTEGLDAGSLVWVRLW